MNEYIWDHLPLRTNLLKADHWIDYHIFNDSPVLDKVLIGRDDWLFFYPAVMEWPQKNSQQVEKFIALAQKATAVQKKTGKEIILIPSPSKTSIYPEFLPDYHQNAYRQNAAQFHERLDMVAPDTKSLLLLWKPFQNEKERLLQERTKWHIGTKQNSLPVSPQRQAFQLGNISYSDQKNHRQNCTRTLEGKPVWKIFYSIPVSKIGNGRTIHENQSARAVHNIIRK